MLNAGALVGAISSILQRYLTMLYIPAPVVNVLANQFLLKSILVASALVLVFNLAIALPTKYLLSKIGLKMRWVRFLSLQGLRMGFNLKSGLAVQIEIDELGLEIKTMRRLRKRMLRLWRKLRGKDEHEASRPTASFQPPSTASLASDRQGFKCAATSTTSPLPSVSKGQRRLHSTAFQLSSSPSSPSLSGLLPPGRDLRGSPIGPESSGPTSSGSSNSSSNNNNIDGHARHRSSCEKAPAEELSKRIQLYANGIYVRIFITPRNREVYKPDRVQPYPVNKRKNAKGSGPETALPTPPNMDYKDACMEAQKAAAKLAQSISRAMRTIVYVTGWISPWIEVSITSLQIMVSEDSISARAGEGFTIKVSQVQTRADESRVN
ncbi:hypothetical protein EV182_005707, partial [Spiromyces aspiralis]